MIRNNPLLLGLAASILALTTTSCAVSIDDYKGELPSLQMDTYFNGPLQAWGIFQDFSGKVVRRFHVQMNGKWDGNNGILDEYFTYADGETQRRIWKLTKVGNNRYTGIADDVVGVAAGVAEGNS